MTAVFLSKMFLLESSKDRSLWPLDLNKLANCALI